MEFENNIDSSEDYYDNPLENSSDFQQQEKKEDFIQRNDETIQPQIQPEIQPNNSVIWTEKYRPNVFEEVVGQEEIIKRVKNLTNSLNVPHMLFAGPAGTGKSTLAIIVAKELFKKYWKENYLELNASDARGIDVVRQEVKNFARTKSLGDVPFKIIFLD